MQKFDAQTNQVWWLAIDRAYTRYAELRRRRVIAQGWPQLGNLQALYALGADPANEALFKAEIEKLSKAADVDNAPDPLWNLSQIRAGDLVVGVEGTHVRGICRAKVDGWSSYKFDDQDRPDELTYAQTVCYPVTWLMWNVGSMGQPPRVGRQGILGCMKVQNERERVIEAWEKLIRAP